MSFLDAFRGVPGVGPAEARAALAKGALLLDVRTPAESREARIPGAVLVPLDALERKIDTLPRDRTIVVQCRSGNRSATATRMLLARGFASVVNLRGGILAWAAEGHPVERGR